jgi:monofunctional biosynthetic peptidoglycan transglycosylase
MGGKSKGAPSFADGLLTFNGTINTNGGGFSSIRTKPDEHDLTGTAGLLLRVKGDGRTYKASLRTDAKLGRWWIPFRGEFETVKDEWVTVFVPYDAMTPSIMGRELRDNPPALELDKVKSMGIMLADGKDGKDGDFELQVDWIKAVKQAPKKQD